MVCVPARDCLLLVLEGSTLMIVVLVLCGGGAPSGQQSKVAWEKTRSRNEAGGVSKQGTNRAV